MRRQRAEFPEKYREKRQAFNARHSERLKAERAAKYAANKQEIRAQRRGVSPSVIDAVMALQGGKCPVCEKPLPAWPSRQTHIDHCHDTGRVRGLLCHSCNGKEGWVRRYGAKLQAYLAAPPADEVLDLA